ncbi:protein EXECUTER 1, chloroplastic-like [Impatiens glandulifera]|uniref:protein EXECUTER 1, chloroplastic-like n=1 Tax=Impatiens glandulifera TaxID=253017 RepID=UPI001FB14EF6|nr:protein EXECUTER 1, chloroplastic-like [Impatiens glandulifera]XP_047333863.1 protein EXECUTER 1, chloroplastic-like [Impatiens glandulifera]XP_047333864.1 protein EXECUTER 1, chloroplastic-like [Impatiens glandulifera]
MASISAPTFTSPSTRSDTIPHKFTFSNAKFGSRLKQSNNLNHPPLSSSHSLLRTSDSSFCRCRSNNNDEIDPLDSSSEHGRWNSVISHVMSNVIRKLDSYLSSFRDKLREEKDVSENLVMESENRNLDGDDEWDWERWSKHFNDVDEQERIVSLLKSQIALAIASEDYQDAARLKVAVAAATTNDAVGMVMSHLNKAIAEEQYNEAVFLRDKAGAGLVGWWSAISEDNNGHIFRISAEHGRYVARSFSPRQLATAMAGLPVFEIFLTINKKGEYRQQAVYLSPAEIPHDVPFSSGSPTRISNPLDSSDISNLFASPDDVEDSEDQDNDSDIAEGLSDFEPLLRDMIPGAKVKVLKVTASGKFDPDLISKVVDQIIEDEDEEEDVELEIMDSEDEDEDKDESNQERNRIEMDAGDGIVDDVEQNEISVKVVIGDTLHKVQSSSVLKKTLTRVPAKLERKGRKMFSFSIEKNDKQRISSETEKSLKRKRPKLQGQRSVDQIMSDLAKSIGRGKIPMKVLRDVGKLIDLTLNQVQNHLVLSGLTTFNRIEVPTSSDPLNGLYIGSHGLYASEVIHLRHKFGQWQDVGSSSETENLQFYEYVEAVKLTGDPYVPAGQVAFRAKIGKTYQLPHKGIIPEEFGVVARYRGQGRLAEPGFKNPRWVDGELVILDGKYIKGGPVVGFVYWVPEYNFLVFFNRLKLQD